jgi:glycine oxidase
VSRDGRLPALSALLEAGTLSKALFRGFAQELEEETGLEVDLRLNGVLAPLASARDETAVREGAHLLRGQEIRDLEPALSGRFEEALFFPGEGSIDNRALVKAVLVSARSRGVKIMRQASVDEILTAGDAVCGVRTGREKLGADVVVNCAGAWAGQLRVPGADVHVRPIKGQMLLLDRGGASRSQNATAAGPALPLYSHEGYVVPRSDGRVVIGTTVEDRGYDKRVEAGAVAGLIEKAISLCPSLATARFVEAWAGLRPRGESDLPTLGPAGPRGYFLAVGHYRNGILLTPLSTQIVADRIAGRTQAEEAVSRQQSA